MPPVFESKSHTEASQKHHEDSSHEPSNIDPERTIEKEYWEYKKEKEAQMHEHDNGNETPQGDGGNGDKSGVA